MFFLLTSLSFAADPALDGATPSLTALLTAAPASRVIALGPVGDEKGLLKTVSKRVARPGTRLVSPATLDEAFRSGLRDSVAGEAAVVDLSPEQRDSLTVLWMGQGKGDLWVVLPAEKVKKSRIYKFVPDQEKLVVVN